MQESSLRWHRFGPPGTFVRSYGSSFSGFDPEGSYSIAALRRVTHPSLHQILDRAAAAAAAVEVGNRGEPLSMLYDTARSLPADHRAALAERRPEAVIPFVGTAAGVLAPLQLLSEVRCIRLYDATLPGEIAEKMYPADVRRQEVAPEAFLMPGFVTVPGLEVRYLDTLWERPGEPWPSSPLVLIANARVRPDGYEEQDRTKCQELVRLMLGLPRIPPKELRRVPIVPDWHFDWGIALIMRAALGG